MLGPDRVAELNLARRALVNRRPLQRVVAALWVAAALVVVVDAVIVVRHLTSSSAGRGRLVELEREIAAEAQSAQRLERSLRGFDLAEQNRHVEFLNSKIAQRTFPWSRLFEQLGEVLPDGVRLQSLRPMIGEDEEETPARAAARRDAAAGAGPQRWVQLQIAGQAETDDAILELVDALFGHPAFSSPNLRNEAQERGLYRFNLAVRYLPDLELEAAGGVHVETAERAGEDGAEATGGGP
jgi:Tfp pilus assembly protein PilN